MKLTKLTLGIHSVVCAIMEILNYFCLEHEYQKISHVFCFPNIYLLIIGILLLCTLEYKTNSPVVLCLVLGALGLLATVIMSSFVVSVFCPVSYVVLDALVIDIVACIVLIIINKRKNMV